MIEPALRNEAFLADVARARTENDTLHLWWLGQSGYLIHWNGRHLLLDPYLSDSLTRKYAATDRPHVRMTERVIAPERLGFVDVVTSSHNHTDHLDPETLRSLAAANPALVMVCPEANRPTVRERSGLSDERIVGLAPGLLAGANPAPAGCTVAGFRFHAVPAAHETLATDQAGRPLYLGFVIRAGPWTIYHSGDTVLYEGLTARLLPFRVDVALLPINGRAAGRRVAGNLWGREAAQLAKDIGARLAVPCHYDMFAFNTATPEEFVAECQRLEQPQRVLRAGERWTGRAPRGEPAG